MKKIEIRCEGKASLPLESLKPFQGNLKKLSDQNYQKFKSQLLKLGFSEPISVWKKSDVENYVLNGHQRLETLTRMKAEGFEIGAVPVSFVDAKDEQEAKRKILALTSQYGEMDDSSLLEFLDNAGLGVEEIEDFNFPGIELKQENKDFDEEKEDEVPEDVEPVCKPGDLWQLGEHRLLCDDCTVEANVEKLMDEKKADMVFTDPPYGVNYEGGHFHSGDVNIKRKREKLKYDEDSSIYLRSIPLISKFVDGPCYTWYADSKATPLYQMIDKYGEFHAMIVWHKINAKYAAMNAQYKQRHEPCAYWKPKGCNLRWIGPTNECTVWEEKRDSVNEFHPTQKPVCLAERAINNHSAKTVLDIFLGSGSTLIACEKTNRKCYGMEIDPHYCDVIIKRWENITGKKAVKIA